MLKRNKLINNLATCLQNMILKNNEFNIAHRLYKTEIDSLSAKLNEVRGMPMAKLIKI